MREQLAPPFLTFLRCTYTAKPKPRKNIQQQLLVAERLPVSLSLSLCICASLACLYTRRILQQQQQQQQQDCGWPISMQKIQQQTC